MRPQVVAHRGASAVVAEHTLGAYLAALDAGAEALECDVRLTADGHLVCVHDRKIHRTTGLAGTVSSMELSDLAELNFAKRQNKWITVEDENPVRDERLDRVLTLRDLIETVRDYSARTSRRVELAIETKHPTRYGGLVERKLVELLTEYDLHRAGAPVRVMSFSYTALSRVEKLAPEIQLVQLIEHSRNWTLLQGVIGPDWIVGPGVKMLMRHPKLPAKITRAGHAIHVWTVNTPAQLDFCLEAGVRAVITDHPARTFRMLGERGFDVPTKP